MKLLNLTFSHQSPRADVVMVVTRSKSIIKTNSLTKTKRGSLGSLTSLTEKNDSLEVDGISLKKSQHASKSLEMDLDAISNEGLYNYDEMKLMCQLELKILRNLQIALIRRKLDRMDTRQSRHMTINVS